MNSRYTLTCDNGQVLTTELHPLSEFEVESGLSEPTIEGEIVKLENLFAQMAANKLASGVHPDGWLDPLPTSITSFEAIA